MIQQPVQDEISDFFIAETIRVNTVIDRAKSATKAFCLRIDGQEVWKAMWRGQVAPAEWTQRGPARAWIDTCETAGRFRS